MVAIIYDQMGGERLSRTNENGTFTAYRFGGESSGIDGSGVIGESEGKDRDNTVICLHGFPDTVETYHHQVASLLNAGYQVVVPVMRGYEPSSVQAGQHYFLNQIAQDIVDWMDYLSLNRAHIVGHDWGALAAWALAGLAPERMRSLTSIAIPPMGRMQHALSKVPLQLVYSWYIGFFQLGKVADWVAEANDWQFIRYLWKKWSPSWSADEATIQAVIDTLSEPGVKEAVLGYYRCLASVRNPQWKQTQALLNNAISMPVQIIYGEEDGCMNKKTFDVAIVKSDFKAGLSVHSIEGAGHFVQLEKPKVVSRLLLEFFSR